MKQSECVLKSMHIVSTNFAKTLAWKNEWFQTVASQIAHTNTNDHHKPLSETPPWKFSAYPTAVENSGFYLSFRGIIRLGSTFIFLGWFKLAHIYIQVATPTTVANKESIGKFLIGNRCHVNYASSGLNQTEWFYLTKDWIFYLYKPENTQFYVKSLFN